MVVGFMVGAMFGGVTGYVLAALMVVVSREDIAREIQYEEEKQKDREKSECL